MEIIIPKLPPSVNQLYRVFNNHPVKSKTSVDFCKYVKENLEGKVTPLLGLVQLRVIFLISDKRKRDLDNLLKVLIDSLKNICFEDDHAVRFITAEMVVEQKLFLTIIKISPYVGELRHYLRTLNIRGFLPFDKMANKKKIQDVEVVEGLDKLDLSDDEPMPEVKKSPRKAKVSPVKKESEDEAIEDELIPEEVIQEPKKKPSKGSSVEKDLQTVKEAKGLGLIDINSSYDTIVKFLPEIFNKTGDGKFNETFVLRPGIDRSPPYVYIEGSEPRAIFKPKAGKNSKWMCFLIGDYIGEEGSFFEVSIWETQDEAVKRYINVKRELKGKVVLFETKCACKKELNFEFELFSQDTTKGKSLIFHIYELICPCATKIVKVKKEIKETKETKEPFGETEKTPPKKSKGPSK